MAYESTTFEKEAPDSLKERAQNAVEQARARGSEALEDTADMVRRHPGKTLAVSALVGGVIGAMMVNAMASEPESRWEQLQDFSEDALEKIRDGASSALCSVRDFIDAAARKLS